MTLRSTLRRIAPLLLGATLLVGAGAPAGAIPFPDPDVPNPYPLGTCVRATRVYPRDICVIIDPRSGEPVRAEVGA